MATYNITDQAFDDWARQLGAPVSTEVATMTVLSLINSRLVDTKRAGEHAYNALERIEKVEHSLSRGEQALVSIARTIWRADTQGASIELLGGLDRTLRRQVLMILFAYYLGGDLPRPNIGDPAVRI